MWTPPYPTNSFADQYVIVTGANAGLGFEAAKHIVRLGAAKVILAVRSTEKGEAAQKRIESETGSTGVVEVWPLDLQSYSSVKEFASRASQLARLDVLLENAAIATRTFTMAEQDESTITTNVVSTFLLALLLLPKLKDTASRFNTHPHLVIVSSEVHAFTDLATERADTDGILAALSNPKTARMSERYEASKLLEVFALRQMVADYAPEGYPVIINLMTPGFCHSELMREAGWFGYAFKTIFGAYTAEQGSRALVNAAAFAPSSHGKYLKDCTITDVAPFVSSDEGINTQKKVWEELSKRLESIEPGIMQNF